MYDRTFGTDWETLEDGDEVLRRAFTLGVAETLGERHPEEFDRLEDTLATASDRQFLEIAYQQGIQYVRQLEPQVDDEQQLRTFLADELAEIDPLDRSELEFEFDENDEDESTNGLPDSLRGFRMDTRPDDSRDRVRRPDLLE
ncbi:hypothetical protein [Natronolimnobius baerhuensis]|uniref:Uncharacterized protein n=1 Tax=Natronolimnobius baerhuensis TaxID=253108 RepID=A0A202E612_9EURY|nr:hypothetical protein [Natronolimnobius baerhuensis]OVE83608.1 hypothetical protein B2G88_14345 [Natronolimnobius baerhuensis]